MPRPKQFESAKERALDYCAEHITAILDDPDNVVMGLLNDMTWDDMARDGWLEHFNIKHDEDDLVMLEEYGYSQFVELYWNTWSVNYAKVLTSIAQKLLMAV